MELAIGLILVGLVVGLSCFIYAAINMKNMVVEGKDWAQGFSSHIGAMVGTAVGGCTTLFGLILLAVELAG